RIREGLGFEGKILCFPHHASHAASAFFYSGFEEAAVFTADGVGEWATTTYGRGHGQELEILAEVQFPHSLGLFYSTFTSYLGFAVNDGEYKVMGLAPYGEPRLASKLARLLWTADDERFALDLRFFDFLEGRRMYSPALVDLLGEPPRRPGEPLRDFDFDLAASVQRVLEEILLQKVEVLHHRVGGENLCLAGGVALNCVANGKILRHGPFRRLFVQPAAGDAGGCLGAAILACRELGGDLSGRRPLEHVYLGPRWGADSIAEMLRATGLEVLDFRGREEALLTAVVDRLEARKTIGWFQGAMEFGPRALGARSILGNPLDPEVRDRLNRAVKQREPFRPFAPSVLEEEASKHFRLDHPSPFMLETCAVSSPLALPGITHVDGSARPQTVGSAHPRYRRLLEAFGRRTGCPMLVNTSFNVAGEPIVCSPADALSCFSAASLDTLVLEDFLIDAAVLPAGWTERVRASRRRLGGGEGPESGVREALYTFV
ncbi:MAG: carbamoyltransferase, partial [Acidobacteria bacterium]|nr:carbamoyltransferase [Acidobacteriota bacterium]